MPACRRLLQNLYPSFYSRIYFLTLRGLLPEIIHYHIAHVIALARRSVDIGAALESLHLVITLSQIVNRSHAVSGIGIHRLAMYSGGDEPALLVYLQLYSFAHSLASH